MLGCFLQLLLAPKLCSCFHSLGVGGSKLFCLHVVGLGLKLSVEFCSFSFDRILLAFMLFYNLYRSVSFVLARYASTPIVVVLKASSSWTRPRPPEALGTCRYNLGTSAFGSLMHVLHGQQLSCLGVHSLDII